METRVAVISIIVEEGTSTDALNQRLHEASPYIIGRMGIPYRKRGINIISVLLRILCGAHVRDTTSGFRASNRQLTEYFAQHYAQDYPEPEAIISAVLEGFRVGEAPVVMAERMGGISSINAFKSVYYMIKVSLSLVVFRLTNSRQKGAAK